MKLVASITLALLMQTVSARLGAHPKLRQLGPQEEAVPGEYMIHLSGSVEDTGSMLDAILADHDNSNSFSEVRAVYKHVLKGGAVKLHKKDILDRILEDPRVESVEPNTVVHADMVQDVSGDGMYGLDRIDQDSLPLDGSFDNHNLDGTGSYIYILDSGIRLSHNEFQGRVTCGWDDIYKQGCNDDNFHGTHVAGLAGGTTYGVAKNAQLIAVKCLNGNGSGTLSGVTAAVDFVAGEMNSKPERVGKCVANLSLSAGGNHVTLNTAVANLVDSGCEAVVSAGNSNSDACGRSPAKEPKAITVGATSSNDERAWFSCYGSCVDIFAPGVGLMSAKNSGDNDKHKLSGTSMSAPLVAGVLATYLADGRTKDDMLNDAGAFAIVGVSTTTNKLVYLAQGNAQSPEPPTEAPTDAPTVAPTEAPTVAPTVAPTEQPAGSDPADGGEPTEKPTESPTDAPTQPPTDAPTELPTAAPTQCRKTKATCSNNNQCCSGKCDGKKGKCKK